MEEQLFLGKLYDMLLDKEIINYDEKPKDLKEKLEIINKYLEKLERVQTKTLDKDRYLNLLKQLYYDKYIIKPEEIPESYLHFLETKYLNEGHGYINLVNPQNYNEERLKEEHINQIIREQKDSLDAWLNYLLSPDSSYLPMWAKVWAFQGMLSIGRLNNTRDNYLKRSKTTVSPFVNIDSEILGKCVELLKSHFNKENIEDEELEKIVQSENFAKIYGKLLISKKELKLNGDDGIWIKYNSETEEEIKEKEEKGIEPEYIKLYNSLQGYNTGWCTAASRETAKVHVSDGDFYVYYSKNENDEYKIPRIAIRMEMDSIGEIRGIAENQNIESDMEIVLKEKLNEFPDGKLYFKKVSDMEKLTDIYKKYKYSELSIEELKFLYEIDEKIKGFGFHKDPRIRKILYGRDKIKDLTQIFSCKEEEIGLKQEDLTRNLKCYYGDLLYGSIQKYPEVVIGNIWHGSLINAKLVVFPKIVTEKLDINTLYSIPLLPKKVGWLVIESIANPDGLVLPEEIDKKLELGVRTLKGVVLPKKIGSTEQGEVHLDILFDTYGLDELFSLNVKVIRRGKIYYDADSLRKAIEQDCIKYEELLKGNHVRNRNVIKQYFEKVLKRRGYVSNIFIVLFSIVIGVIIALLILR